MKVNSASSTSLLIARGLLQADATPALRPLLVGESAALTRRLLDAAGPSPWFAFALRHHFLRRVVFAVERLLPRGAPVLALCAASQVTLEPVAPRPLQMAKMDAPHGGCVCEYPADRGMDTYSIGSGVAGRRVATYVKLGMKPASRIASASQTTAIPLTPRL